MASFNSALMFECLFYASHFVGQCHCNSEQWRFHCLFSGGLWSQAEHRCSSNKLTSGVYAQIVVSPLKERNMVYNERVCQEDSV